MNIDDPWDPAHPNKERTRESRRMVGELLWAWDAIGVAEIAAADEYDCMISPLLCQLHDGVSEADLSKWISSERVKHFGLEADPAQDARLASDLKTMWERQIASP